MTHTHDHTISPHTQAVPQNRAYSAPPKAPDTGTPPIEPLPSFEPPPTLPADVPGCIFSLMSVLTWSKASLSP
jgi:hypothetical protein